MICISHPDILILVGNLGTACQGLGRMEKAQKKYEEVLKLKLALNGLGKQEYGIATSLNSHES